MFIIKKCYQSRFGSEEVLLRKRGKGDQMIELTGIKQKSATHAGGVGRLA